MEKLFNQEIGIPKYEEDFLVNFFVDIEDSLSRIENVVQNGQRTRLIRAEAKSLETRLTRICAEAEVKEPMPAEFLQQMKAYLQRSKDAMASLEGRVKSK